tara:strand:- start:73 stop:678 length:606 start_codon:yes stop_codon:yes gene_type:complete
MSLFKRKKLLEEIETVEYYLVIILIGCFIFLIIQNPGEVFTERMWLVLLILVIVSVFYKLILNKYKTGNWNDDGKKELNQLRKILKQSKQKNYPNLIFDNKYDENILELEEINRLIKYQVKYYSKIENKNSKKIKKIENELSRYGDLINDKDIKYLTRVNKILELKKDLTSAKLKIEILKRDFKRKENKLSVKLRKWKKDQ